MNILLTGGAGFIGSAVTRQLIERGVGAPGAPDVPGAPGAQKYPARLARQK
jgi:nucleoside-diphosphate-sugar epimerase